MSGSFTSLYSSDCPTDIDYSLVQMGSATFDATIFTFSPSSPTITISTEDLALVGQTISLELTARLSSSGAQTTDFFMVEFTDGCSTVELTPVTILTS